MLGKLLIGSTLSAALLWGSAASACLPPPPEAPIVREAGESDEAYQARVTRLRAEALAAAQASYNSWALHRENSLWDSEHVTRVAVVDVVEAGELGDGPPSMNMDILFRTVMPERGMASGERFTLSEPRFSTNPCIPVVNYPVGGRYVLFASDGPISHRSQVFLLLPVAEVRSERGLALLRAADR